MRCLLLLVASVVVCHAVEVPLCDRSLCSCAQPNGQLGDAVKVDDGSAIGCLCACGRAEGEACATDDHCAQGTLCAYPKDLSLSGFQLVCTNKCASVTCGQYQRCSLDNYEPVCGCRTFDCEPSVVTNIEAIRDNAKQVFPSKCAMANANCELLITEPTATLWNPIV